MSLYIFTYSNAVDFFLQIITTWTVTDFYEKSYHNIKQMIQLLQAKKVRLLKM